MGIPDHLICLLRNLYASSETYTSAQESLFETQNPRFYWGLVTQTLCLATATKIQDSQKESRCSHNHVACTRGLYRAGQRLDHFTGCFNAKLPETSQGPALQTSPSKDQPCWVNSVLNIFLCFNVCCPITFSQQSTLICITILLLLFQ